MHAPLQHMSLIRSSVSSVAPSPLVHRSRPPFARLAYTMNTAMPQHTNDARDTSSSQFGHHFRDVSIHAQIRNDATLPFASSQSDTPGRSIVLAAQLQRKEASLPSHPSLPDEEGHIGQRIQNARGGGNALPTPARSLLEAGLKADLSNVRIHTTTEADTLARSVNATAFTTGADIFFRSGMYNPTSENGLHLLAHEATHTVQQSVGPVAGIPVADNLQLNEPHDRFEREADATATRIVSERHTTPLGTSENEQPHSLQAHTASLIVPHVQRNSSLIVQRGNGDKDKKKGKERGDVKAKSKADQSKKREDKTITELAYESATKLAKSELISSIRDSRYLELLHVTLPLQLEEHLQWLEPEDLWSQRSQEIQKKRAQAQVYLRKLYIDLLALQEKFPDIEKGQEDVEMEEGPKYRTRQQTKTYSEEQWSEIKTGVKIIRNGLAIVGEQVKDFPPPPKSWDGFMGDTAHPEKYHEGTSGDPIPVIWYKRKDDYQDIVIPGEGGGRYSYPNGPTVRGRKGKYTLQVDPKYQIPTAPSTTAKFINMKESNERTVQVDINYALNQVGANMAGKDGDHVTDLGFGGVDKPNNYWPLLAKINRRPFLGWRGNYGINYKRSKGDLHTAPLTALGNKVFVIKGFMQPGDGNVPTEGEIPNDRAEVTDVHKKSGTSET